MKLKGSSKIIENAFLSLLPIQAVALGMPALNTLIDNAIVGSYFGEQALAAIAFISPLTVILSATGGFINVGAQMLSSRCIGKGDKAGLNGVFSLTLLLCAAFGLFYTAAMLFIPGTLAKLLGATGAVGEMTRQYLIGVGIGTLFSVISVSLLIFLQMDQMKTTALLCSLLTVIINIGGNFLNALLLHWGIFGIGLFTSLANIIPTLIGLIILLIKGRMFKFSVSAIKYVSIKKFMAEGVPYAIDQACNVFRLRLINHFLFLYGGTVGIAAFSIAQSITKATGYLVKSGIDSSTKTIDGVLVGQQDTASLRIMPKIVMKNTVPMAIGIYVVLFVFARPLSLLMGAEDEYLNIYISAIRIVNSWFISGYIVAMLRGHYQAIGNLRLISISNFANNVLYPLIPCILLSKLFGIYGIFMVSVVDDTLAVIFLVVYYCIKTHQLPKPFWNVAYIPPSFGIDSVNKYTAAVNSVNDAVAASCKAYDFCLSKGINKRTCYLTSLCLEEIAVDAVKNRFTNHKATMDCSIVYQDGHINMMIRDDCTYFNPKEWLELCSPEDEERSVGIRMIMNMASDVKYINTLGLNVLMIDI